MYGFFGIGFQEQLGKRLLGTVSILDRVGLPHRFQSVLRQFENLFQEPDAIDEALFVSILEAFPECIESLAVRLQIQGIIAEIHNGKSSWSPVVDSVLQGI